MNKDKIIWARYGAREYGQWVDVTEKVRNLAENTLIDDVNFGPVIGTEGKAKSLWMLRADGSVRTVTEGAYLTPPENWEELLYATRKPRAVVVAGDIRVGKPVSAGAQSGGLVIHSALYGLGFGDVRDPGIDVTERLRSLVSNNSLDVVVNNSTITPGQNPYRGKKKHLSVIYSFDGGQSVVRTVEEKDWLIIGPAVRDGVNSLAQQSPEKYRLPAQAYTGPAAEVIAKIEGPTPEVTHVVVGDKQIYPTTPTALNDYLIRRFSVSPQRLRGPMPIEVPQFHRNDLAQLFAELGFKRGAEIGVAEGNYSEVLLKANPECELLLVDPWHHYSENPQGKSKEKHEFAYNEVKRKTASYSNVNILPKTSMHVINNEDFYSVASNLDFCYIDGNHSFDYVMQDLIEWSKRVRSGGIVSGDDYYELDQKRWTGGGVVEAVQAYTKAHRIPIWWLFAGHKSVDYLWVKP